MSCTSTFCKSRVWNVLPGLVDPVSDEAFRLGARPGYPARDERIRFQVGLNDAIIVCNDCSGHGLPHANDMPGIVVLVKMESRSTLCMFHVGVHHVTVNDAFVKLVKLRRLRVKSRLYIQEKYNKF